jgi:hypothetical protein
VKIFLAGQYPRRDELAGYASELKEMGHVIKSRWLDVEHSAFPADVLENGMYDETGFKDSVREYGAAGASVDLEDAFNADTIISFTENPVIGIRRGARHVEFGVAVGINVVLAMANKYMGIPEQLFWGAGIRPKRLIVVGYKENIYHLLPDVEYYPTWEEAKEAIGSAVPAQQILTTRRDPEPLFTPPRPSLILP